MKNNYDGFAAFGRKVEQCALDMGGQDLLDELFHYGNLNAYVVEGWEDGWTAGEVVGQAMAIALMNPRVASPSLVNTSNVFSFILSLILKMFSQSFLFIFSLMLCV